jgi:hypothetical protein
MLTVGQIAESVQTASMEYPLHKVELFGSYASEKTRRKATWTFWWSSPSHGSPC